ncbi:GAF domain-containing protein [Thalassospira sp. HJ]|uniref:GAF domain-containing protein n=1 Tax=Thalassospira sp. HJ TaxID=1616823 RepID=UPI000698D47C|nr:GAF domain-containing protein [Thalassospira sp. HJ]
MHKAALPDDELDRQKSLESMGILTSDADPELDRITRVAQRIFGSEIVAISLLDNDRQFFKSNINQPTSETPRDISFCGHVIHDNQAFVVEDATNDDRFRDNPLVTDAPFVRSYAGVPLTNPDGFKIGTLCVVDTTTRQFSTEDLQILEDLGLWAETIIALRYGARTPQQVYDDLDPAKQEMLTDPKTRSWNATGMTEFLHRELINSRLKHTPIAIYRFEIDDHENLVKTYGKETMERVVQAIASAVTSSLRDRDVVGRVDRYGFACLMPGAREEQTSFLGFKLCDTVREQCRFTDNNGDPVRITVSVGATWAEPEAKRHSSARDILDIAGSALKVAREQDIENVVYHALPVPADAG